MNITGIKVIFSGIFFFSTFLCSTIPICLFSWIKNRNQSNSTRSHFSLFSLNTLIHSITCFGGGIFLGACLLDLLPEVIYHVNMTMKTEFQYDNQALKRYPVAELLISCGLFLVLFIEQTILSCHSISTHSITHTNKKPTIILSHEDDETSLTNINDQDPLMTKTSPIEHRFDISEHKEDIITNKNRLLITRNFILILSLIIHSLFEGIALGATKEYKPFLELFFAIIIHKSIIAFSVGLKIMSLTNKRLVYFACFLFSIATPMGILFVVSMEELLPKNRTAKIVHEVLRAFACGTFFYITFFDVLPHELNISTQHRHVPSNISNRYRLLKVICIIIGFSFIAMLSFLMK
jgi:zinc transporter 1/2/3